MTEKILIALLAGLTIWAVTNVIMFLLKRDRFREAILVDIQGHIDGANEQARAAKVLIEETIRVGEKIPFPISYDTDNYSFYSAVQKDLPLYLEKGELVKVVKLYNAIWQLDVSVNGLATTVGIWERDGVVITEEMKSHLKKRLSRITSFRACMPKKAYLIKQLPDDYREVKDADTVVAKS